MADMFPYNSGKNNMIQKRLRYICWEQECIVQFQALDWSQLFSIGIVQGHCS